MSRSRGRVPVGTGSLTARRNHLAAVQQSVPCLGGWDGNAAPEGVPIRCSTVVSGGLRSVAATSARTALPVAGCRWATAFHGRSGGRDGPWPDGQRAGPSVEVQRTCSCSCHVPRTGAGYCWVKSRLA